MARMSATELDEFLTESFPHLRNNGIRVEIVDAESITVRLKYHEGHLRPGGTISGPSLMMMADVAMYLAVLAQIGPVALAVTTNLNINFLRKPAPADVIATARLLKLGTRLAIGEVSLRSAGEDDLVAHATVTYSIPPRI
ncbi:MAG: PaaI family thioesterase [Acidobacteriota bacterium]